MELPLVSAQSVDLVVIGGGASGFMGAITAAEEGLLSVYLLEGTSKPLEKVRISGGGRCNVTNACWDPKDLVTNYPRGRLPLMGLFSRFSSGDAVAWFAERGLELVAEEDGRMFPVSNNSCSVVECLRESAKKAGVVIYKQHMATRLEKLDNNQFLVHLRGGSLFLAKKVLIATGGHPSGRRIASSFGHLIIPPVPSLFTLGLEASYLKECKGIALDNIYLSLDICGKRFEEIGRILLTHWGLSGPAVLRLSAFSARDLFENKYKADLTVKWIPDTPEQVIQTFNSFRLKAPSSKLSAKRPFMDIPKRLWVTFIKKVGIDPQSRWSDFSNQDADNLTKFLISANYKVTGRGPFGEEFVTAGGVSLAEINILTMESKLCVGLHFAGELLNIDGVTGGFNFQHCWTSGWLAGKAIAGAFEHRNQKKNVLQ